MARSPPRSTLFPYTTALPISLSGLLESADEDHLPEDVSPLRRTRRGRINRRRGLLFRRLIDRKSTRLNSSHQIISYAVFCLKKKKHTKHLTSRVGAFTYVRPH